MLVSTSNVSCIQFVKAKVTPKNKTVRWKNGSIPGGEDQQAGQAWIESEKIVKHMLQYPRNLKVKHKRSERICEKLRSRNKLIIL